MKSAFLLCVPLLAGLATGCGASRQQAVWSGSQAMPAALQAESGAGVANPAAATGQRVLPSYRVSKGDRLKIWVYNVEKLTGEHLVSGDGRIAFPILGRVTVQGLTLDQIAALLTDRLADGYYVSPSVGVDIAAYRPVYILGEVQKPGQYPYSEGLTVDQLAAQAGGYTYRANRKKVRVQHDGGEAGGTLDQDSPVSPGDTVTVKQRFF